MKQAKPTERDLQRHCARVYLVEARRRRERDPTHAATLLRWARAARNRSNAVARRDLFGRMVPA